MIITVKHTGERFEGSPVEVCHQLKKQRIDFEEIGSIKEYADVIYQSIKKTGGKPLVRLITDKTEEEIAINLLKAMARANMIVIEGE